MGKLPFEKEFNGLEFNNLLVRLIEEHHDFTEIIQEPMFNIGDRRACPDIVCTYKKVKYIIECKRIPPLTQVRVSDYIHQLKYYGQIDHQAQLVLAIPYEFQDSYVELFKKEKIIIWDIKELYSIFQGYLEIIKDTFLYNLLSDVSLAYCQGSASEGYVEKLKSTAPGNPNWSKYQKLCVEIIEFLFCPPLSKPFSERSDDSKVNRKDIILPNYIDSGFWKFIRDKYYAEYIVVECKNHKDGIEKNSVLQVANYLKLFSTGLFGMIFSRVNPRRSALVTQREQWMAYQKMILIITDEDLIQMLKLKDGNGNPEEVIRQKIEDFRLSL